MTWYNSAVCNCMRRNDMKTHCAVTLAMLAGFGLAIPAYAQSTETSVVKLPQDMEFKGPLTGAPQTAILYGDPTKPGVFVSRVKFSAGWKDPPHWHPDEVRTVVVLSGTLYFGSGDKWDESKFRPIRPAHSILSLQKLRTSHGRKRAR